MSSISDQTEDSQGSLLSSDCSDQSFQPVRSMAQASLSSISQRIEFSKANSYITTPTKTPSNSTTSAEQSSPSTSSPQPATLASKSVTLPLIIVIALLITCGSAFAALKYYRGQIPQGVSQSQESTRNDTNSHPHLSDEPLMFDVQKLFDPVQVSYIQSYEESALGKYYYWDLLAEEYFRLIRTQLIKIIWMEEDVIEQFFKSKYNHKESEIIRKKVWRLREKCDDIVIDFNINNNKIWRYVHCFCTDPQADRTKLSI